MVCMLPGKNLATVNLWLWSPLSTRKRKLWYVESVEKAYISDRKCFPASVLFRKLSKHSRERHATKPDGTRSWSRSRTCATADTWSFLVQTPPWESAILPPCFACFTCSFSAWNMEATHTLYLSFGSLLVPRQKTKCCMREVIKRSPKRCRLLSMKNFNTTRQES